MYTRAARVYERGILPCKTHTHTHTHLHQTFDVTCALVKCAPLKCIHRRAFFITLLFSIYLPFSYSKDSSLVFPFQLCFVFSLFSFSFYLFPTHSFFFSNNKFKRVNVISFSCGKFSVWRQKTNLRFIRIPLISWDRVRRIRWDVRGVTHCEKWRSVLLFVFFLGGRWRAN